MSERNHLTGMYYNTHEKGWKHRTAQWCLFLTLFGKHLGTVLKGYWYLGPRGYGESFEVSVSVGGEDNVIKFGLDLPYVARGYVGVRVPRALTKGWIYEGKKWALRIGYVGRWVEVMFASEEHMRDCGMVSYYKRKRERGGQLSWNRVQLWAGVHWTFAPRLKDKLLGKVKYTKETVKAFETVIPLPEGNYSAKGETYQQTWVRPRWPFSRRVVTGTELKPDTPIPVPGKGENSWDIGDDAIYSSSCGGQGTADAVGSFVATVTRSRLNYAGPSWVPDKGWPDCLEVRS